MHPDVGGGLREGDADTDAQADGGEIAHAAQARLQAQAAEAIASTVFSIVEDMKPVFCKPRDRFAPCKFLDSSECGRMGQLELFFQPPSVLCTGAWAFQMQAPTSSLRDPEDWWKLT